MIAIIAITIAIPLLIYALGDFPRRTPLKEIISVFTILAYFIMVGQFFLSRANNRVLKGHKMWKVSRLHKVIGYIFTGILLFHPFFIVLPRYFEAGLDPKEALVCLLTTFDSRGVILGISAWCLMLIIGITSILRGKLGLKYNTWRTIHGILSILFISLACWHAIDLGRHTDPGMSVYMIALSSLAVGLLLKTYFQKSKSIKLPYDSKTK